MAGCTKSSAFIVCFEELVLGGAMKLMAAGAVCRGKGLMQAESSSFICFFFMAGEAKCVLRGDQEILIR